MSEQPDARAYRFLETGDVDGDITEMSYAAVGRRARAVATELQNGGWSGQRALLLYPPGLEFISGFYGCLMGAVVAVPVPLPQFHELDRALRRLQQVIADADIHVVLSTRMVIDGLSAVLEKLPELASLTWIATEEIADAVGDDWRDPGVTAADTAFLQYTSGSTSAPRGVIVSHGNLLDNQRAIAEAMDHSPEVVAGWAGDMFVSWLPVYHDMGLIGPVLQTVYQGCSSVLMSPLHFLQKPQRWLEAVSAFGAHTSGSPNFGYELCIRRADPELLARLDLSRWRVAFNGAEPVRASTLRRFSEVFAPAGFRASAMLPVYGLAEATLLVTGGSGGGVDRAPAIVERAGQSRFDAVSSGRPSSGITVVVADPELLTECPAGEEGEIWVAGASVAGGYLGDEAKTRETFGATLDDGRGGFLRTGDLGFLSGGELFVTGRRKDLLIIDGKNHYPHDLEMTIESSHPDVRAGCVAVFSVDGGTRGELPVAVAEVKATDAAGLGAIERAVRAAVAVAHGVALHEVVAVRPRTILKTSSGKIQRLACRDQYLAGELAVVAPAEPEPVVVQPESPAAQPESAPARPSELTAETVAAWLVEVVAHETGTPAEHLDVDRPLAEFGLGSRGLVELAAQLSELVGRQLEPSVVFEHPTIAAISAAVTAETPRPVAVSEPSASDRSAAGSDAAVAIIGLACRFPGGADDPESLWRLLADGVDAVGEVPAGRWDTRGLLDPDPEALGRAYTLQGGFLDRIDGFDAAFFGITAREAQAMDPQQRLLLQTAWEALERAGYDPQQLSGSATGVYVGMYDSGYLADAAPDQLNGYVGTGTAASVASGRIAYALGLEGPAVTVDTACSSSLVALHLAAQALRAGDCELALAGGVSLLVTPRPHIEFSRLRGLSPSGRCKPFAADADGMVWAEGAGLVVLKRLDAALRDGDPILAVVRGSAVNQDGRSQGLSAPNGAAQERVLRAALDAADLAPGDIDYVEAHGTGTTLGDPIEARALARVFGPDRPADRPLGIGSLKSNIGHAQAAAGIGGVLKVVLALRHATLPPSLHAAQLSTHIDWARGGLALQREAAPWPAGTRPRRAGVSSFGISGTNAHVILEEPPVSTAVAPVESRPVAPVALFPLSARSEAALRGQAERLHALFAADPELSLPALRYSLAVRRGHFERRAAVLAHDRAELLDGLRALAAGETTARTAGHDGPAPRPGRVAFVFPGQGAQWAGMGRDLLARSEVFAAELTRVDAAIRRYTGWSVTAVLREEDGAPELRGDDVVQPVLFAVMVSLAAVWRARGVNPDAVIGHSQGEVAAAYVSGALSLADAAAIVVVRSRLLPEVAGAGAMAMVGLSAAELAPRLPAGVTVAAQNSGRATVLAGDRPAVVALLAELDTEQVFTRLLAVDYASHTAHVEPLRERLTADLAGITANPGAADGIAWYSTVTAARLPAQPVESGYWYTNLREPVRFADTVTRMIKDGYRAFVELSPHPSLLTAVHTVAEEIGREVVAVGSLRREADGPDSLDLALGELYAGGASLDWTLLVPAAEWVELPTYAWDEKSYWTSSRSTATDLFGLSATRHPLLGVVVPHPETRGVTLSGTLSLRTQPWLADHMVFGRALLPGTGFIELVTQAGAQVDCPVVRELVLSAPLPVPDDLAVAVQVLVGGADTDGEREVAVYSRIDDGADRPWTRHAQGALAPADAVTAPTDAWPPADAETIDVAGLYDELTARGYGYGPALRGLRAVWRRGAEIFAEVSLPEQAGDAGDYRLHPALLDAALHAVAAGTELAPDRVLVPFGWSGVRLHATGASAVRVRISGSGTEQLTLHLTDDADRPVADIATLTLGEMTAAQLNSALGGARDGLWTLDWTAVPIPGGIPVPAWTDIAVHPEGAGQPVLLLRNAPAGEFPEVARIATESALARVKSWLRTAEEEARLVVLTSGAVAIDADEDVSDLCYAPVWGLLRSAQSEYPDRIVLVDIDNWTAAGAAVAAAVNVEEPQLALRHGRYFAPRLSRAGAAGGSRAPQGDPNGTVLVTGGTGALGRLVARHLVSAHGVRNLLLASRSGAAATGSAELIAELAELGASARIAECDLADRAAVAALLAAIPADQPLIAVIHAAGVLADAVFAETGPEQLAAVFAGKVDAAWHLHELTKDLELAGFVLFSSAAGILGAPGQAGYAAANSFLDALAQHRRRRGLPANSLAWGLWQQPSGMTGSLDADDLARLARGGMVALSEADGLGLFDAALQTDRPLTVPAQLNLAAMAEASLTGSGAVAPVLRGLVRPVRTATAAGDSSRANGLRATLSGLGTEEQEALILKTICEHLAAVVDHLDARAIDTGAAFQEIGIDSLGAVEFRNRLQRDTGLKLPITVALEHPTPAALARHLQAKLGGA